MKKLGFLSLCVLLCAAISPLEDIDINFTFVTLLPNILLENFRL